MRARILKSYCCSICLVFASFSAVLLSGCAGITSQATAQPTPVPSPTPQSGQVDRVLLQTGAQGTIYKEFAVSDSGLEQVGNDITLPTPFSAVTPPVASVHGFLFALDSGPVPQLNSFIADPTTATFSPTGQVALQAGPSFFSTDPSGSYLYVNESHDDSPSSYESNLNAFHIESDGTLTQVPGAPFIFYGGPGSPTDCCFGLGSPLAFTPGGTRAYAVTVQGCPCHGSVPSYWTVQPFVRDANTGAITKNTSQPGLPPTSEFLVGGVAVAKNGKFVVFPTIDGLMVYTIDPATGSLTQTAMPSPVPATDTGHLYLEIAATKDGEFIYLDQPQSGLLFGFHVENDGPLTPVPGSPYNTGIVSSLTVSSSGNFIFAVRVAKGFLAFKRDPNTGGLVQLGFVPMQSGISAIVNLN